MSEDDRRSPLHDQQVALGADFYWEDGWPWAMKFADDPLPEYEAIRTATGLWDLFSTCKYEVTGPDAARFVQRRCTNDVVSMEPGQVRYGAFVNADGTMTDDGNVYRHAADRYWVLINTADLEDWFREPSEDLNAFIEHRTADLPMISVQGPTSRDVLRGLTDAPIDDLRYFRFWPDRVQVAGVDSWLLRTGFSGELGFELVTDTDEGIRKLWDALVDAGGAPFGLAAVDIARVEAGLVIIALDYQPGETSPYDVSMDRFIKASTECVGSEALAGYGGNPPNRFKTLTFAGDAPEAGATVVRDEEAVGMVTSPTTSPRLGAIGLAILRRDVATDGMKLEVGEGVATVAPLCLYDPEKKRPRG
jgi:aminomethyltransferase